jgi:hypothetical protein
MALNDPPLRLVNARTGFIVVEYRGKETLFRDPFLMKQMRLQGVPIPLPLRSAYGGKARILLGDPLFQKAFREVYCPLAFGPEVYRWR